MFRKIRAFIGLLLICLARAIVPRPKEEPQQEVPAEEAPATESVQQDVNQPKPIHYQDLKSYVEKLKVPADNQSACVSMCGQLRDISRKKKGPVRLNFAVTSNFDKTGETTSVNSSSISGYRDGRWYKLRDLNEITVISIVPLIEEMINIMGQDGWGCMNDSSDQLSHYLSRCLANNQTYVEERCKRLNEEATIRVQVALIVDDTGKRGKEVIPIPQILIKISVRVGKTEPVESTHSIYFHRKHNVVEKSQT